MDHLEEGLFGVDEFDHALEVYLAAEEVGVDELAGGGEGAVLVDEAGDGARDGGEGVGVHDGGIRAVFWLERRVSGGDKGGGRRTIRCHRMSGAAPISWAMWAQEVLPT